MFEILKYQCQDCGGYTDQLTADDLCLACANAPDAPLPDDGGFLRTVGIGEG
jgi:hypothetical protein